MASAFSMAASAFSELPFWRSRSILRRGTKTSKMVQMIKSYNKFFKGLSVGEREQAFARHRDRSMGEFLFQVNKIEGEGFDTYEETQEAISKGALGLEGKQDDEKLEAVCCLHRAFRYVYDEAAEKPVPSLSVERILEAHNLLMKSTQPEIAGRVRVEGELAYCKTSKGALHVFMWPTQITGALQKLITESNATLVDIFEKDDEEERIELLLKFSGHLFLEFEHIHPFGDGNGRIGRILVATVLQGVFPFPNVLFDEASKVEPPFVDRNDYIECFSRAQEDPKYPVKNIFFFDVSEERVSQSRTLPPVDLTAMIIEGVYLGWKRFLSFSELEIQK